ncbi:MAG TPA: leucine-rich repeat domain-containing protein, partial [Bacteroidetes bacterium]|nr:leucine-rich repeat domain-containing protein [Bacteroidota bacterium]
VCPPDDWGLFYADLSRFSQLQEIRFLRIKKPELSRKILDLKNLKKVSWIACESVGNLGAWKGLANVQQIDLIGKVKGLDELLEKARFSLRLKHLALHNMSLSGLPKSIFQLDQLKTLDLTGNQLATLSDAFGKFKNLERLILVDNNFSTIPEVLKRLPKLKWVDFYGNPIQFSDEDRHWLKGLEK